jgi:hypothetical protein
MKTLKVLLTIWCLFILPSSGFSQVAGKAGIPWSYYNSTDNTLATDSKVPSQAMLRAYIAAFAGSATLTTTGTITSGTWAARLNLLEVHTTSTNSLAIDCNTTFQYTLTALASDITFLAPTGSPISGQHLLICIIPDATPRNITWTLTAGGFRASSDMPLPAVTVASKTMYMSFIWNATAERWDYTGYLGNF